MQVDEAYSSLGLDRVSICQGDSRPGMSEPRGESTLEPGAEARRMSSGFCFDN